MTTDSTSLKQAEHLNGLSGDESLPIWRRIAHILMDEIARGEPSVGGRLPSEAALASRFGVNRHTLRRATGHLAEKGYVRIRAGAGIFVRKRVLDYALHRSTRLTQNLADNNETAVRELLDSQLEPAHEFSAPLQVDNESLVRVLRLRSLVRQRPIALSRIAFPSPRLDGLPEQFVQSRSISNALEALGVRGYHRTKSVITSRLPTNEEADWLSRPITAPVIVVAFSNADEDGVPVEAGSTVFAADSVQLIVDHF